jgi:ABC transporter substrate binding protein
MLAFALVESKVDVIVTGGTAAGLAAKKATSTIPIVFAAAAFPERSGLIATYARPGGNVTGLAFVVPEYGKRLELLRQVSPRLSRVDRRAFIAGTLGLLAAPLAGPRAWAAIAVLTLLVSGAGGCAGAREPSAAEAARSAQGVGIALPEMLAVELPGADATSVAPGDSPLRELLEGVRAGGFRVTHDLRRPIGPGATEVTWTAWEDMPGHSAARGIRTARIHVFPFGLAPVGLSGDDRATVGNQSAKVARDGAGRAHMVWLDAGRRGRGIRVMYRRAAVDPQSGGVTWETEPLRVSDQANEFWNSYPVIEASDNAIHIAWAGSATVQYRRLVRAGDAWVFEPIRDTRVPGPGEDWGPGLGARNDAEIHLLTPSGRYALSTDGGRTWTQDRVPVPRGLAMKGPALAVDAGGNGHVTFTGKVRSPAGGWRAYGEQHGAYWELRYVRRRAAGGWEDAQNVLAEYPEWRDRGTREDVLVDFSDIAVDRNGNLHVGWHGSANTAAYSFDEAFYVRRTATGAGTWGRWGPIQTLHPLDPSRGEYFSYGPSLSVDDESDAVLAVLFFDTIPRAGLRLDSAARVVRDGRLEGPAILLTRSARDAVAAGRAREAWSTWFPCAAPRVYRGADRRAWLDVLQTVVTSPGQADAVHYVVYLRREVTAHVGRS